MPGKDRLSVPVAKPVSLQNPEARKDPPPDLPQDLTIPARELASGALVVPGALDSTLGASLSSLGPGSGGGAGTGTGTGIGPGSGSGLGPGSGGGYGGGVMRPGAGIDNPIVLREVKPGYTPEAMRMKIQGVVWLEGVVRPDGTLTDIKVSRSLDPVYGLDQEAIKAARQWRFVPAKRFGQPVALVITIEMSFTLH